MSQGSTKLLLLLTLFLLVGATETVTEIGGGGGAACSARGCEVGSEGGSSSGKGIASGEHYSFQRLEIGNGSSSSITGGSYSVEVTVGGTLSQGRTISDYYSISLPLSPESISHSRTLKARLEESLPP